MKATRQGYGDALVELGQENPNVVVLDADLAKSTTSYTFAEKFPKRFIDCGVAEQLMMGVAAGLAASGKIAYTGSFAIFATGRAFEQVRNIIAYSNLNVKLCPSHAGVTVGADGSSHQAIEDISLMRAIPNMKIIVPSDYIEAKTAVKAAAYIEGPIYIRLGRAALPQINADDYKFEFGKALMLRQGKDATIFAVGIMVAAALEAADNLAKEGIDCEVINLRTVKPLDKAAILDSVAKTKRVVTAECHTVVGGVGSAICELLAENIPLPVAMVGIRDRFGQSGSPDELLEHYGLTAKDIEAKVKQLL
ncbi:MAG: transketolase family protein [Actinobacteria bacterium]|nr:MAG: transketolase family protein [Actinomycetota bacterium]